MTAIKRFFTRFIKYTFYIATKTLKLKNSLIIKQQILWYFVFWCSDSYRNSGKDLTFQQVLKSTIPLSLSNK